MSANLLPADPVRGASGADLAYCRGVLPRVSRTFAANIGVLRGPLADQVTVAYLLCRTADAPEDSWPGPPDELAARLPVVLRVLDSFPDDVRHLIVEAVCTMARGMQRYAVRAAERAARAAATPHLDTQAELHEYCFVVAGCVGVMLTRLFARRAPADDETEAERLALAPIVGESLQLTNILLDWPTDIRRGRCYVPAEWLAEYRITPSELIDRSRVGAGAAARRLEALARAALGQVPEYLDHIPVRQWRYRMFVLWPALWALASLRRARSDPEFPFGERRPRLNRDEVRSIARRAMLGGHSRAGVRKLFATLG